MFAGKHVYGVLCGRSVQLKRMPSPYQSAQDLVASWKAHGYMLLLPSGAALACGDSMLRAGDFEAC